MLDLMDVGRITCNRITPDQDLSDAFMLDQNAILPDRLRPSIHLPFFDLQTERWRTVARTSSPRWISSFRSLPLPQSNTADLKTGSAAYGRGWFAGEAGTADLDRGQAR